MKRRITASFLAVVLCFTLVLASAAQGGTSSDPVVSKSYVDGTFFESVIASARSKIESSVSSFKNKYITKADSATKDVFMQSEMIEKTAEAVLERLQKNGRYLYSTKNMAPKNFLCGDVLYGKIGTMVIVKSGFVRSVSGNIINITKGSEVSSPNALGNNTAFMFTENGGSVEIITNSAELLIDGVYSTASYKPKYTDEAYALKKLGIVRGAANGMELHRGNTRAESITMLIRLLGEEDAALATAHSHPFGDVDTWAQRYVGYAYRMGYTNGVSANRFDGSSRTIAMQYVTFILRSLGYSEEAGDFKYATAVDDAVRLGVIPKSAADELNSTELRRDHVMHISYLAMSARVKGSNQTLLARLVANGAVSSDAANEFLAR